MIENAHFTVIDSNTASLAANFSVDPSSCENSEFYREYLLYSALNDLHTGRNTTHLFIDNSANRIMGFVALRSSAIISYSDEDGMTGMPALEVSVLAVDKDYAGQGVGRSLIDYVIYQADELHRSHVGLQYIVLAADKNAVGFYEHMDFVPIENRWYKIPKEQWSARCVPMSLYLAFENDYIVSYADDEDDEE